MLNVKQEKFPDLNISQNITYKFLSTRQL